MPEFNGIKHVLLDIEGTICPISFVKDTLFPYAIKALPEVLRAKWDDETFILYRDAFSEEHRQSPDALREHVEDLTKRDVKVAYLKNLQGYLWEDGYKSGAYSTPLFADVVPQLREWKGCGCDLAIYSSGSVFAQKLLFQHVAKAEDDGGVEDLRDLIAGWYDTTNAGSKLESESYAKIAERQDWESGEVLFLSDNVKEVQAATKAGMQSVVIDRPGNAPLSEEDKAAYVVVDSLRALNIAADQPATEGDDTKLTINGAPQESGGGGVQEGSVAGVGEPLKKRKQTIEAGEPAKAPRRSKRLSSSADSAWA